MGTRIAKLVPTLLSDGSVKYYDPITKHVWIQHIDGVPNFTMKVPLTMTGIDFDPNPSQYYVVHTFPEASANDIKMQDVNIAYSNDTAALFEKPGLEEDWTVELNQNAHGIVTGLKVNPKTARNMHGIIFVPKGGMMHSQGAIGPNDAITKPGIKYGTSQSYGKVFTKNPLSFLPSFAFLPLPAYLPSMEIFGQVTQVSSMLKEVIKAFNDARKG